MKYQYSAILRNGKQYSCASPELKDTPEIIIDSPDKYDRLIFWLDGLPTIIIETGLNKNLIWFDISKKRPPECYCNNQGVIDHDATPRSDNYEIIGFSLNKRSLFNIINLDTKEIELSTMG